MPYLAEHTEGRDAGAPAPPIGTPAPRLLVAVDNSRCAGRTLVSGLAQAAALGADVTVVHVVPPRRWRVGRSGPVRAVPMRVRDPLESPVLRDARRLGFENGIVPRLELIAADEPDTVVLGLARRSHADTIVVGAGRAAGRPASRGAWHGVLRRAAVPVFVIPV